jgi:hypothetical protein
MTVKTTNFWIPVKFAFDLEGRFASIFRVEKFVKNQEEADHHRLLPNYTELE